MSDMAKPRNPRPRTPFGVEVKKKLAETNQTQTALEVKFKMPKRYLSEMIRGRKPGAEYAWQIAEYLNIDLHEYPQMRIASVR